MLLKQVIQWILDQTHSKGCSLHYFMQELFKLNNCLAYVFDKLDELKAFTNSRTSLLEWGKQYA